MNVSVHKATAVYEPDMLDAVKCECGWHSRWYYDGRERAQCEWQRHAYAAAKPTAPALSSNDGTGGAA